MNGDGALRFDAGNIPLSETCRFNLAIDKYDHLFFPVVSVDGDGHGDFRSVSDNAGSFYRGESGKFKHWSDPYKLTSCIPADGNSAADLLLLNFFHLYALPYIFKGLKIAAFAEVMSKVTFLCFFVHFNFSIRSLFLHFYIIECYYSLFLILGLTVSA